MPDRVDVLWRSAELRSNEFCTVQFTAGAVSLESTTLLVHRDLPARIEYTIETNARSETERVGIELSAGGHRDTITLEKGDGGWVVNGLLRPDLERCIDVDLGWTPATNLLPLRRHSIEVGESMMTAAALVRYPELDVVHSDQTYTRLDGRLVRYQSGTFEADLTVTPDGIVTKYGDSIWTADAIHRQP